MKHSGQGIVRDANAQEQPADKKRAQTVHTVDPSKSVSREATRDPKLNNDAKSRHSRARPDEDGDSSAD